VASTREDCTLEFDTLIVGGGSAGCVLAARLSEDPNRRVALLEAGRGDRSPWLHVPAGTLRLRGAHWNYAAEPDASRHGSVDPWRTGRVIGGGSSVNAMVWVRGHPADFDGWAKAGATGWDYASLLPYFRRAETWEDGANDFRGGSGPQRVSWGRCQHPVTDAFMEAAQQAGHPFNPDYNAERQEGAAFAQVSQRRGWRHSTARAYLSPARRRANLEVIQEAFVTRVLFEGQRAVGVEYRQGGELKRLRCTREVVVSAGTIASPKVLLASGVGAAGHLRDHGVPVVADNPAVGRNLQEHATTMMLWHVNVRTLNTELTPWGFVRHGLNYALRGRGPASASMGHALAFFRLDPDSPATEVEAQFCPMGMLGSQGREDGDQLMPGTHDVTQMQLLSRPAVTVVNQLLHPEARGSIELRSADPNDTPVIRHELFGCEADIARLAAACRRVREIFESPALAPYLIGEALPGKTIQSDEEWEHYLRHAGWPGAHAVGSCSMGTDANPSASALDPQLRVRGVTGLRVADASVMPSLPSGNTNAPVIAVAEKAADLIRASQP